MMNEKQTLLDHSLLCINENIRHSRLLELSITVKAFLKQIKALTRYLLHKTGVLNLYYTTCFLPNRRHIKQILYQNNLHD